MCVVYQKKCVDSAHLTDTLCLESVKDGPIPASVAQGVNGIHFISGMGSAGQDLGIEITKATLDASDLTILSTE